jgi:hypothetical protein
MRDTVRSKPRGKNLGDLRPEYHFDYSKSKPNRFVNVAPGAVTVVLDPDVAKVFKNARSVNEALRTLIANLPPRRTPAGK